MRRGAKQGSRNGRLAGLAVGVLGLLLIGVRPLGAQQIIVGPPPGISVVPGAVVEVPILVDMSSAEGLNIASLQIEVTWNGAQLQYLASDQSGLPAGWTGIPNETNVASGSFAWAGFSPTGTTGSFVAATLLFEGIAPDGTTTLICMTVTAAGDMDGNDLRPIIPTPRCVAVCSGVACVLGDVSGDEEVNIIDCQLIARHSLGLPTPNAPNMSCACDPNEDGACDVIDAQVCARHSVGLSTPSAPSIGMPLPDACDSGFTIVGTIGFVDVEGGCWIIGAWEPINLPPEFRVPGLTVRARVRLSDGYTICMVGMPVWLLSIETYLSEYALPLPDRDTTPLHTVCGRELAGS